MTEQKDLQGILGALHTDENRASFLKMIYHPGDTAVADNILSLNPADTSVLEKEIEYAREHGQGTRYVELARRYIDDSIAKNLTFNAKDKAIEWNNPTLANYAIDRLTQKLEDGHDESTFEYAIEIAEAFGKKEKARELLKEVLKYQLANGKYPFTAAGTYARLGQYDEAIDLYLKSDYDWICNALKVAREHAPEKLSKVAQKGFDTYRTDLNPEIYVECAEILGKTGDAKKVLSREAKDLKPVRPPRVYRDLVKGLIKLGLNDEAKDVVAKVAKQEVTNSEENYYDLDRRRELATLFDIIGDTSNVREIYLININMGIRNKREPSNILGDIAAGFELTGDAVFLGKKLLLLEQLGKYDEASKVAAEMGDPGLADTYLIIAEMIQKANATQTPK